MLAAPRPRRASQRRERPPDHSAAAVVYAGMAAVHSHDTTAIGAGTAAMAMITAGVVTVVITRVTFIAGVAGRIRPLPRQGLHDTHAAGQHSIDDLDTEPERTGDAL